VTGLSDATAGRTLSDMSDANTRRPRGRNPRRQVLAILRAMKKDVSALISWWDQAQTVIDVIREDGRVVNHKSRPRREDERVENDIEAWISLAAWMDQEADAAHTLANFARDQVIRLSQEAAK
jgi:hypothetical protein